jgi:microcystin degradation protein MlrC
MAHATAESIAQGFWDGRAKMQATPGGDDKQFLSLEEAVATAQHAVDTGKGTVILTDAADATSSGASGNGASILVSLVKAGYTGSALVPLVDPEAVEQAFAVGVGGILGDTAVQLGGSFDGRFTLGGSPGFQGGPESVPHAHEGPYNGVSADRSAALHLGDCSGTDRVTTTAVVTSLSDGESIRQRWTWGSPGRCCTLQIGGNITVAVISNPVVLMTDDVFLGLGHDPRNYDAVVIKTPHAQPEMFDDWAYTNIGVDAPGATTADVSALGHTIARTPTQMLYPMDTGIIYRPQVETIQMAIENALAEAEAEEVA